MAHAVMRLIRWVLKRKLVTLVFQDKIDEIQGTEVNKVLELQWSSSSEELEMNTQT